MLIQTREATSLRFLLEQFTGDAWKELRNFKDSNEAFEKRGKLNGILEVVDALNSILNPPNDASGKRIEQRRSDTPGY